MDRQLDQATTTTLQPSNRPQSNASAPKKFTAVDAPDLLKRLLDARFSWAPQAPEAHESWLREAVKQLGNYFAAEVETAATFLIGNSKQWPTFADMRERLDKDRADKHGRAGGLKTFRDRSPDKTPDELQRRMEHIARLKRQFPTVHDASKDTAKHWADEPIEHRPFSEAELDSAKRLFSRSAG